MKAEKITLLGVGTFPSRKAAAEHEGITPTALYLRIKDGYYTADEVHERELETIGMPSKNKHYQLGQHACYRSQKWAAQELDIKLKKLQYRIRTGQYGSHPKPEKAKPPQHIRDHAGFVLSQNISRINNMWPVTKDTNWMGAEGEIS